MAVHLLADAVGHILQKQRGQISCPVRHTGGAESPFHVLDVVEPRTLEQQRPVHDAPGHGGILTPQETHHGLHHLGRRQHILPVPPAGSSTQPRGSEQPVHRLDAQIGLHGFISLRLQPALQHRCCGIRCVELRERRRYQKKLHTRHHYLRQEPVLPPLIPK